MPLFVIVLSGGMVEQHLAILLEQIQSPIA
jgi:hypothetical protein